MNFNKIKKHLENIIPFLGGMSLFFIFFLYGLVNNLSISYMGNTSKKFEEIIFNNFLGYIVIFILKILLVYLTIGLIIGVVVQIGIISFSYITKKNISNKKGFLLNLGISFILYIQFFLKDIIHYPQVYMNNFYIKNRFNKFILEFTTDNFEPSTFKIILFIMAVAAICLAIVSIIKTKNKLFYGAIPAIIILTAAPFLMGKKSIEVKKKHGKPNVLILASDALRPDHFSGYGYSRKTTPNIDRLINEGTSFTNTFIEVPRTFPSWVSILTGQFASRHGIRHMFPTSRDLNRDFKSITKIFNKNGYETSVIADFAGDIFTRIDLDFNKIDTPYFSMKVMIKQIVIEAHTFLMPFITGEKGIGIFPVIKESVYFCPPSLVKDRIIDAINRSNKPFFMTTFFSSTHYPYSTPYPYYKMYAEKDYNGPYKYYKQRIISLDKTASIKMSHEDIEQVRALYDGGIRAFDDSIGEIIATLKENKIYDNTIIIVLSDHGENLYEDGLGMGHGEHFRGNFAIKIPFIIRYPGIGLNKQSIAELVRHVDIAPTILSILNMPVPGSIEGTSLLPLIKGKKIKKLNAFGETGIWFDNSTRDDLFFQKQRIMYPDITSIAEIDPNFDHQIALNDSFRDIINLAKHRYVFDGRYKLIYMPMKNKILYEMYDIKKDPLEKNNIAYTDKKNFQRLKNLLFKWVKRDGDVIIRNDYIFPILRY